MTIESFKNNIRDISRFILTPIGYAYFRYVISHRRILNLSVPKSYTEKIQFRKFKSNPSQFGDYVDKLVVKDIVSKMNLDIYIPKTLHIFDNDRLELAVLNQYRKTGFVIKTSHGGGGKFVDVVSEKSQECFKQYIGKYINAISVKTGSNIDEYFYDLNVPKIFLEENLTSLINSVNVDFKFHVFNGIVEFIQLNHRNTDGSYSMTLVNPNFELLDFTLDGSLPSLTQNDLLKPKKLEQAINIAETLGRQFSYVRVDFYISDDLIIFGELTFCPSSGWSRVSPPEADFEIGKLWNLDDEEMR